MVQEAPLRDEMELASGGHNQCRYQNSSMKFSRLLGLASAFATCFEHVHAGCQMLAVGRSTDLLLKGDILTPHGVLSHGHVLVQSGKITQIRQGCEIEDENATVIDCSGAVISPGFINTHEHIAYSTVNPFPTTSERWDARQDWRLGLRNHTKMEPEVNGTELDATKWGELRHLFSGTTSIVGGDMVPGLTRNLDFIAGLEDGLVAPKDTYATFPLNDAAGPVRNGDCDYGPNAITQEDAGKLYRYLAHIGEGVDAEARNEFKCLSNLTFDTTPLSQGGGLSTDIIAPNLALIHALGLTESDYDLVSQRGAMVVWSPRSNVALYGKTLNVTYLQETGITVALGTDWLPSGSATMGREAVCGCSASETSYGFQLEAKTIWEMMTINAAKVAGFERQLGSIEVGKMADIVIWGGNASDPYAKAAYGVEEDIELVLRGGKAMLMSAELKALGGSECESLSFGSATKVACVAGDLNSTFAEFEAALGGVYPAILPGIPPNEPTCEPTR
ncbi:metal dependent amidohydrolase [Thozetella sp. PMI_491]|nr:metal dependent amidohydrolase [Thozetella sp. PMI_491]